MKKLTNEQLAYFMGRCILGINFLVHGLVRIPKLSGFAKGVTKGFEGTLLPEFMATGFAYAIPLIELILGLLLLLGLKTRNILFSSGVFMGVLIFGSGLKEDWTAIGSQMVHAIVIYLLLFHVKHNAIALDSNRNATVEGFRP